MGETNAKSEADQAGDIMEVMDIDHLDIPTFVELVLQETYHPLEVNI